MGEVIQLHEFQFERRRAARRPRDQAAERTSLARAIEILKDNLAASAAELRDAASADQDELLTRVERLTAMVRYAIAMAGEAEPPAGAADHAR
ncbi:MAG: hypothetical protein IVW56_06625 [Candidatus Binataceae bacterium]|nr:hypothetical protein [Candidatus Binataceae bacterium]